ncbi:hypothetical protein SESBI_33112 [Sesbania bispinosa]|nr:hypothetical protein SESBI_33112 [Sesbania bispinosa]
MRWYMSGHMTMTEASQGGGLFPWQLALTISFYKYSATMKMPRVSHCCKFSSVKMVRGVGSFFQDSDKRGGTNEVKGLQATWKSSGAMTTNV